ncbi:OLC1v1032985C1 [Oldenlandia corymbosa var. corymbosa]|nr:OLC1v1032985C1 [Oldenlandia corymbosa var. corymbosa]
MTYPTKALAPLMLEDYYRVMVERKGEEEVFSTQHIMDCLKKVTAIDLKQTVQVDGDLQIRPYYAGHVLGAAMFYAKVGDAAIVYTGDYNMTADRHLGAAQIDKLQLDLVITESTYATTLRDSKYVREREFLKVVHNCVAGGGKVLIPSFALGRAQELCMLLDDYWERMNLKIPIYFSSALTIQANKYYKTFISWTSQKVKDSYATRNPFDFKHVHKFERSLINAPGPCVLFATPGMISGGFSLEVFKQWAPNEGNLITLPGYCVAGTIGHRLMSAKTPTQVSIDQNTRIDVRCQIHQLSFSPHTDAKGIMDLIRFLCPKHVMLVHGEKPKMESLKARIVDEYKIPCCAPANNESVIIPSTHYVKAEASDTFLCSTLSPNFRFLRNSSRGHSGSSDTETAQPSLRISDDRVAEGVIVARKNQNPRIIHKQELPDVLGKEIHEVQGALCVPTRTANAIGKEDLLQEQLPLLHQLYLKLADEVAEVTVLKSEQSLHIESVVISVCHMDNCLYRLCDESGNIPETTYFCCKWSAADQKIAWRVISVIKNMELINS